MLCSVAGRRGKAGWRLVCLLLGGAETLLNPSKERLRLFAQAQLVGHGPGPRALCCLVQAQNVRAHQLSVDGLARVEVKDEAGIPRGRGQRRILGERGLGEGLLELPQKGGWQRRDPSAFRARDELDGGEVSGLRLEDLPRPPV